MPHRTIATFVMLLCATGLTSAALTPRADRVSAILSERGLAAAASVRSVALRDGQVQVDFDPSVARGLTDAGLEAITAAVRAAFSDEDARKFRLTANGRSLAEFLPATPIVAPAASPPPPSHAPTAGPLTGRKIVLSPGHGWTYYGTNPYWHLQRAYYWGIVEDFQNAEMIREVYNLLVNSGATVYVTREMDFYYGDCTTSYTFANLTRPAPSKPWWQMAALYYAARMGAPATVYNNGRSDDYNRDIAARPLYANHLGADIMVSLHNNGFNGTARGTETLYDTGNGYTVVDATKQLGSQYLAQKVQNRIINEIRANYSSTWANRSAQGFDGNYGENRIATRPAILIEVAFMDNASDNAALQDPNYCMLVAKAIYEGICDYFQVTPTFQTNITGPTGVYTARPWTKATAFNVGSPVNAPISSSGGWIYAGTDAGILYGASVTPASGLGTGLRWKYPTTGSMGAALRARPTVYGDTVYAVTLAGRLAAVNRLTGALKWQVNVPNAGNLTAAPAATADGLLVIGSDNGYLYSYRQDTGGLVSTSPVPFGAIRSQAAIPDAGHVWVTSEDGRARCLVGDLRTVLWETATDAPARSAPYVLTANNAVYFTNENRAVFALNASNGSPANGWPVTGARFGKPITTSLWPDAIGGFVTFGMEDHSISASYTDAPLMPSTFPLRPFGTKPFTSDPLVVNGYVVIGGTDGRLYALKPVSGPEAPGTAWRVFETGREPLPGPFNAAPAVTGTQADDRVVAGNQNGWIYVLPLPNVG